METNTAVPIPGPIPPVPPAPLPAVVAWLGYGGLAPLRAPLLAIVRDPHHHVRWQQTQLAYGAVIPRILSARCTGVLRCCQVAGCVSERAAVRPAGAQPAVPR